MPSRLWGSRRLSSEKSVNLCFWRQAFSNRAAECKCVSLQHNRVNPQHGWCRASIHRRQVGSLRPSCHCVIYSRQRVTSLYGDCLPDNGGQGRSAGWCSIFRHTEREGDRPDSAGGHPPFPYCFPIYFSGMTSLSPVCLISSLLKNSL